MLFHEILYVISCDFMFVDVIWHRIHGAGIYANINGVYWWDHGAPYIAAYMDPMAYGFGIFLNISSTLW